MARMVTEKKNWLMLAGAVLLAALAFWLTNSYLQNQELRLAEKMRLTPEKTVRVVVAKEDLPAGAIVGEGTMSIREFPAATVSPSAITPESYSAVENHMIKFPLASGEALLKHHVDLPVIGRFSELLYEGERAVSFDINSLDSISGMLLPGDYIDVLVELEEEKANSSKVDFKIKPLIQRVRVLAVDEFPLLARDQENIDYGGPSLKYGIITVAAPYRDAVALTVAKNSHAVRFLLRNEKDEVMVSSRAMGGYELFEDGREGLRRRGSYFYYSNATRGQSLSVEIGAKKPSEFAASGIRRQLKPIAISELENE